MAYSTSLLSTTTMLLTSGQVGSVPGYKDGVGVLEVGSEAEVKDEDSSDEVEEDVDIDDI